MNDQTQRRQADLIRRDWAAALTGYEAACQAREGAWRRVGAAYAAIEAHAPHPLCEDTPTGRRVRWGLLDRFDRDGSVAPADRARLRGMLGDWLARERHLKVEYGLAVLEAEDDAAADAKWNAFEALMAAPPPDAAALAQKMLIHSREHDDFGMGYANPRFVHDGTCAAATGRGAAQFYRDALTLAALAA
jgi:hypothetical protein